MVKRVCVIALGLLLLAVPASAQWQYVGFAQITVDSTSGGVTFPSTILTSTGHAFPTSATCSLESNEIRWTVDGTAPTTTVGHVGSAGGYLPTINGSNSLVAFKAIRTGGSSGILSCSFFAGGDVDTPLIAGGGGGGGGGGSVTQGTSPWVVAGALAANGVAAATNRVGTVPAIAVTGAFPSLTDGRDASLYVNTTGAQFTVGQLSNDNNPATTNRMATLPMITETSAPTRTNGRNAALSGTVGGAARVMITNAAGAATTIATDQVMGTATYTEASSTGPLGGLVRSDVLAALGNTTNEIVPAQVDALGAVWIRHTDPCAGSTAKTFYVVNLAAAATVEIANAVASQFFYICSVNLVTAGASAVLIAEDDTDGCGSLSAGLNGGTTAATGWTFAANGGISLGNGMGTVLKTTTANRYLCIAPSGTGQLSGSISYVSAP